MNDCRLTEADVASAVWCVAPGIRRSGAAAVGLAVAVAVGSRLPLSLWRCPGFARLADFSYDFVARNRHRLP